MQYPANVPLNVDCNLFYTIGMGANPCPICVNVTQLTTSLNNITSVMPDIRLLQSQYFGIKGVFTLDFQDNPPVTFNYTGAPLTVNLGTSILLLSWCYKTQTSSQRVTPISLAWAKLFWNGKRNWELRPGKGPTRYNLVDPPERNTMGSRQEAN
jgi:laccase